MEPKKIHQDHDHFFIESMEHREIAWGIVCEFVDPVILEQIRGSTFEMVKGSWVDTVLNEHRSDIVYRVSLLNRDGYVYFLFEHKSNLDAKTPRQIFRYMNQIWEEIEKQEQSFSRLPVIIPVIVYHDDHRWNISNSIKPLYAIINGAQRYLPDYESVIIDLTQLDQRRFRGILKAFLMSLKYSRTQQMLYKLPEILSLVDNPGSDYYKTVLIYIGSVLPKEKKDAFFGIIQRKLKDGDSIMKTIADALREEGKKEGKVEGKIEGKAEGKVEGKAEGKTEDAREMLLQGMSIGKIHQITGLSIYEIVQLQIDMGSKREDRENVPGIEKEKKEAIMEVTRKMLAKGIASATIQEVTGLSTKEIGEIEKNMNS
ncbi:MAG: Rpn family recombination-promoting nuclease/putative transposase [Fibrobacterota bacterium]